MKILELVGLNFIVRKLKNFKERAKIQKEKLRRPKCNF